MASPYSYDLRAKAINAVKSGTRKSEVCRLLKISRNTLDLWLKRKEETGDFPALTGYQQGRTSQIQDLAKFRQFVLQHKEKTQQQIADLWEEDLTQQHVSDLLKKLGITRKKTYGYQERDGELRQQFLDKLTQIDPQKIVYVDEAGFDNREDYPYGYSLKGERCYAFRSGKRRERTS